MGYFVGSCNMNLSLLTNNIYFFYPVFSGYLFDIVNREGFILGTSVIVNGLCNCAIPFSKNVNKYVLILFLGLLIIGA